ncbi:MAG TPA: hypothetical protein P5120_07125 [Spirochaetota bacterium]|nr:hypothetical protein [Spirochaetota bacterium]HPF05814.1 hypothetical protein [Spirochaetota bacterium]HPJ42924.1 hypothetical protein [Spirochaetota bacterium]HPR37490.1 hypothetical protein [Spirochaetota bacterium]HRX47273.1 hypothetical protein [Spirochaetota bacterium]
MNNLEKDKDLADFRKQIATLDSSLFDGHTCFTDLTHEQRLDWLAELVTFVHESRSLRIKHKKNDNTKS